MSAPFASFTDSTFTDGHDNNPLMNYGNSNMLLGASSSHANFMPTQQSGEPPGYLHTPSTQQLYHNWQCANETSNRITTLYQQTLQENTELRSKVKDLEAQLARQQPNNNRYDS